MGAVGAALQAAGHDLNYLALTGALAAIGRSGSKPTPPLNLGADFGGGALYLAFGMACAMVEAQRSGKGQVVDAAMTEGAASLMTTFYGLYAAGLHKLERGTNLLDSGSAIYEVYECADGRYISIAPIELKFRKVLFELLGLPYTADDGPQVRGKLEELFRTRTRDEWCSLLEGTDACFAPVLTMEEAPHHPHNVARGSFIEIDGVVQPGPAPRFSRTPCRTARTATRPRGRDARGARRMGHWERADRDAPHRGRARRLGGEAPFAGLALPVGDFSRPRNGPRGHDAVPRAHRGDHGTEEGVTAATSPPRGSCNPRRARYAAAAAQNPCRSSSAAAKCARRSRWSADRNDSPRHSPAAWCG